MTTAAHLDRDPYLLPLPSTDTPVVAEHLVVPEHAHLNARYSDLVWPLATLTANPSQRKLSIYWRDCPAPFQDQLRRIAWTLINGQLRPTYLRKRSMRLRSRLGITSIAGTVRCWMHLAAWLHQQGITTLAACTRPIWEDYAEHLGTKHNRERVANLLGALTRLWAFDQLTVSPAGIARPPWDEFGVDDYLPAATTSAGGENATEVLAAETMGPLLIWAMRMVDDLADDILAAWAENRRLTHVALSAPTTPQSRAALEEYLKPLLAEEAPLPAASNQGEVRLARIYIGGLTGASKRDLQVVSQREGLSVAVLQRPGPCPLDLPVTGRIAGKPWREHLDFTEAATLMRHLGTAAFVVCGYLTGMRPEEVLGLRSGCCPAPEPDANGVVGRHLIHGLEYKTSTDEHGNHLSTGTEREVPWVGIAPVVNAIRVLERMVPDGHLLFEHDAHDLRTNRPNTGSIKSTALGYRIEDFIVWANAEAAAHGLVGETIPPDPHGRVGTARFRRSLAWHIARRPNGLVALAIQYGHLRTTFPSQGYASRGRDGIHDLIDIETALAVTDTAIELREDLQAGAGVSGPAARRAITTATRAPQFAGTTMTATAARRLLANPDAVLYDNPNALLLCHYRRAQALCQREGSKDTAPSLDRCDSACGNVVRTDRHATQLRERADLIDTRAAHTPGPIGDRLRANARKLRALADRHDSTRITHEQAST